MLIQQQPRYLSADWVGNKGSCCALSFPLLITKVCLNESFIGMISIGKLVVPEVEKERIKAVAEAL